MPAPLKGEDAKRHVVTFRLTEREAERLDVARFGMSRGEWCRRQIVRAIATPPDGVVGYSDSLEDRIIRGEEGQ